MNTKFRVWDKNLKKFDDTNNYFIGYDGEVRYLTWNSEANKGPWGWYVGFRDKRDDVIIQFWTGLVDKNRKEIYEGDIVKGFGNTILSRGVYEVIFDNLEIRFRRKLKNGSYHTTMLLEYDLIGNIFENSELLEGKQ